MILPIYIINTIAYDIKHRERKNLKHGAERTNGIYVLIMSSASVIESRSPRWRVHEVLQNSFSEISSKTSPLYDPSSDEWEAITIKTSILYLGPIRQERSVFFLFYPI